MVKKCGEIVFSFYVQLPDFYEYVLLDRVRLGLLIFNV